MLDTEDRQAEFIRDIRAILRKYQVALDEDHDPISEDTLYSVIGDGINISIGDLFDLTMTDEEVMAESWPPRKTSVEKQP